MNFENTLGREYFCWHFLLESNISVKEIQQFFFFDNCKRLGCSTYNIVELQLTK